MRKLSAQKIASFQKMILTWWQGHRRDLPWRRTHDPYRIMVSEVMLQQTQVPRVLTKYEEFLKAFPTVFYLAKASPARVLRVWKGMGYNRRALYLQRAATILVSEHHGKFPKSQKELVKLPGLGTYTARAILVFAYMQEVPLVDTNIRQIITHFFFEGKPQKESVIEAVARQLLPKGKSWEWHQALMDYGALRLSPAGRGFAQGKLSSIRNVPFRDSNRFYRGRIIDRLREGDMARKKLIREFEKKYTKPAAFFLSVIASLIKDGLVEQSSGGTLRLPGE